MFYMVTYVNLAILTEQLVTESKIHLDGEERAGCLLNLSSWCLVMVERLFLAVPRCCLRFVIVVFPDHTH